MAMLSYNEITVKKIISYNDEPYEVLASHVFRKQQRKPVNQVKMRSLQTGSMAEVTFHQNDKVEEAEVETKEMKFIYSRGDEWVFCPPDKPSERTTLPQSAIGDAGRFLKEGTVVQTLIYEDEPILVNVPIKVELEVTEAPPNIKGNTAQGGNKLVTLETGAAVTTPMFIEVGDKVRVNTESGEYVERV